MAQGCTGHRGFASARHLSRVCQLWSRRVGEAKVPGPFNLGVFNPTGLNGKHEIVADLPVGIHAVSETHLAVRGTARFQQGLRAAGSSLSLLGGHPAPLRSRSSHSGDYTGVGFLSPVPARTLPAGWSTDIFQSSRVQVAAFFVEPVWVTGAVVYGYAVGRQRTPELLEAAANRVIFQSHGPRFLAGDWNLEPHEIPFLDSWRAMGFRDVQDVAQEKFGMAPRNTCKQSSRKDYLFLSPELQQGLTALVFQDDVFPDHTVIIACFEVGAARVPRLVWRMPRQPSVRLPDSPLPSFAPLPQALRLGTGTGQVSDPSVAFAATCSRFEARLSQQLVHTGAPPLRLAEKGRALTLEVKALRSQPVPISKARQGEVDPKFFAGGIRHLHWFKQLRRLQALRQNLHRATNGPNAQEYRASLWAAICRAPGFGDGFRQFWPLRPVKLAGDLHDLPWCLPSLEQISQIFDSFQANVDALERRLAKTRSAAARARRERNPYLIFRDLKDEPARPVASLLQGPSVEVEELDSHEAALVLREPCAFDASAPLWLDGVQMAAVHAEPDKVWFAQMPRAGAGATLSQQRFIGDLQELFRAFGTEWSRFWQRHGTTDPSRWEAAINESFLPQVPEVSFGAITPELWRREVRRKKSFTASGLDGLSRQDLLLFPDDLLSEVLDIYAYAEATGRWPRQALEGLVAALEKRPSATSVAHFRPITVLSLIYRVWSSCRSRQCLRHLGSLQVAGVYGNVPGKAAAAVWYRVQLAVETSRLLGGETSGVVLDLVKAYNHLPRLPVLAASRMLGIPASVIRGWAGFLGGVSRRFKIRGSIGPPLLSNAGFPEGCGMSCVAMCVLNLAWSAYMTKVVPAASPMSYVDNWEVLSATPEVTLHAYDHLLQFCSRWDLLLDHAKTFAWATSTQGRVLLRQRGLPVKAAARDLGGHVQYSAQQTNFTQVARLRGLEQRWIRLRESPAPMPQKVRALTVAAWPRALHGVSLVHLGPHHIASLRTGAMRGLNARKPGASAKLQLSLLEHPAADPGFQALYLSLSDLRRHSTPDEACHCLGAAAHAVGYRVPGPCGVLLDRLHAVGIAWDARHRVLSDVFGRWSPWEVCQAELGVRLAHMWQRSVAICLNVRQGFQGLTDADPVVTRRCYKSFPPEEQSWLRVALNGTFYTQAELFHISQSESNMCLFCGQPDGIEHRLRHCPFFQPERMACGVPPGVLQTSPPCQLLHCWAVRSPRWLEVQRCLAALPSSTADFHLHPAIVLGEVVDLFTDGSCLRPAEPVLRLAAWAVVLARDAPDLEPCVVSAGLVPGIVQTAFRAEILAVFSALRFACRFGVRVRVWSDCQGVVALLRALLEGSPLPVACANADLWGAIVELLPVLPRGCLVQKVPAHEDIEAHEDPVSFWAVHNNTLADSAATQANLVREKLFWEAWNELEDHIRLQTYEVACGGSPESHWGQASPGAGSQVCY